MEISPFRQCFRTPCANGARVFTTSCQVFEERNKESKNLLLSLSILQALAPPILHNGAFNDFVNIY